MCRQGERHDVTSDILFSTGSLFSINQLKLVDTDFDPDHLPQDAGSDDERTSPADPEQREPLGFPRYINWSSRSTARGDPERPFVSRSHGEGEQGGPGGY
jgi:hypothetical protein